MRTFFISILISLNLFGQTCVEMFLKLRDADLVKIESEIKVLEGKYVYLDHLWDQLDGQARFQEKLDTTSEMETVMMELNTLKGRRDRHYKNLSERISVRREIESLDKEWDRLDKQGNQNIDQQKISEQLKDLSEYLKELGG